MIRENNKPEQLTFDLSTLLLAILAAVVFTFAMLDDASSIVNVVTHQLLCILIGIGLWYFARKRYWGFENDRISIPICLISMTLAPLGPEFVGRLILGYGNPADILMLVCLQNGALVFAAFSYRADAQKLSSLMSSFLVIYSLTISTQSFVLISIGVYGIYLLWWMMDRYWEKVNQLHTSTASEKIVLFSLRSLLLTSVALVTLLVGYVLLSSDTSTYSISGFFPTSGGDQWEDSFASDGIGDGDALVAAKEDAMTFGPVESDLFLDSEMPTLYDVFNDIYGDEIPPRRKQQRTITISSDNIKEMEQEKGSNHKKNGKEFSTVRRQSERKERKLKDRESDALLYLIGRVPLHLALERFDQFDGKVWSKSERKRKQNSIRVEKEGNKPWIYLTHLGDYGIYQGIEPHALKIINLSTQQVPTPPQLAAVHIDKLEDPEFFNWSSDDILCMTARDAIPQFSVIHLRSQTLKLNSLRDHDFTENFPRLASLDDIDAESVIAMEAEWINHYRLKQEGVPLAKSLALEITKNVPRGWLQVEAIVNYLRENYVEDKSIEVPEESESSVEYFLQTGRGPSYLFASTASVMLRELGYPTRLATGFYANDQNYNTAANQTAVYNEDVHVWLEVAVTSHTTPTWISVEPTPGYQRPYEVQSWTQRLANNLFLLYYWSLNNSVLLGTLILCCVFFYYSRVFWIDRIGSSYFRLKGARDQRSKVFSTLQLLELRTWLAGLSRPEGTTLTSWYQDLFEEYPLEMKEQIIQFNCVLDRYLYSPETTISHINSVENVCNQIMIQINTSKIKNIIKQRETK